MKVALSWLREFVDLPQDISSLVREMDDLGLVIEGVEHVGEGLEQVVIARIDEIRAIEGADRIRHVIVDAGNGPVEIVCGATNFALGDFVPLAPVGAVLPGGFEIALRKMRGVVSNGMLCSGKELGLGDDHSGLMLLTHKPGIAPGQRLIDVLSLESDVVLDISPEGNRPDAWSVVGIARDLAARFQTPLRDPARPGSDTGAMGGARASIQSPELCGALLVAELSGVVVTSSPSTIARRLEMAGMRSINNVVDASNYVMLERGQPTHPYDAAAVAGQHIGVRRAVDGESLETLDGVTRVLGRAGRGWGDTGIDCVITDGNDAVIGIAGVMGGASSEIRDATTNVLLEVAFFDPMTIARTSKRLGLRSEASHRFERGVDFANALTATARFVEILSLSCPDLVWVATQRSEGLLPELPAITVSEQDVERLLGTAIPADEIARILSALHFSVTIHGASVSVTAPASRLDIRSGVAGRADVIEEIARVYGYGRLARRVPTWSQPGGLNVAQRFRRTVRASATGMGWLEAWTPSLISDEDFSVVAPEGTAVRVTNPLASQESIMRTSMLVGLTDAWASNADRGHGEVALFEMGVVATHPSDTSIQRESAGGVGGASRLRLPVETSVLSAVLGREGDDARVAVASVAALAERWGLAEYEVRSAPGLPGWHPTRMAEIIDCGTGTVFGYVGEVDPEVVAQRSTRVIPGQRLGFLQIDLNVLSNTQKVLRRPLLTPVPSRFPSVIFDLSLLAPKLVSASVIQRALRSSSPLVESATLFDTFSGGALSDDIRSVTFAIRLSSDERTLNEDEVLIARGQLLAAAAAAGAELRL